MMHNLPPWTTPLNGDLYFDILDHIDARSDILQCRQVSWEWERITARRLLRTCNIVLRTNEDIASFHRFMLDYDHRHAHTEESDEHHRITLRRFHFLTGHLTLAVGHIADPAALNEIFEHATRLSSLAVEDFDATVRGAPEVVQHWAALSSLRKLTVGYPNEDRGEWTSDTALRSMRFPEVTELHLDFGKRQKAIPLGYWAVACPKMQRMQVITEPRLSTIVVVRGDSPTEGEPNKKPSFTIRFELKLGPVDGGVGCDIEDKHAKETPDTKIQTTQ